MSTQKFFGGNNESAADILAQKRRDTEKKALANVKPFLVALFDETINRSADGKADITELEQEDASRKDTSVEEQLCSYGLVSRNFVPSGSYEDTLERESAKPQRLNFLVSTDRVPLTTKTAPPTFTNFKKDGTEHENMLLLQSPRDMLKNNNKALMMPRDDDEDIEPMWWEVRQQTDDQQKQKQLMGGGLDGSSRAPMASRSLFPSSPSQRSAPPGSSWSSSGNMLSTGQPQSSLSPLSYQFSPYEQRKREYRPYTSQFYNEEKLLAESHLQQLRIAIRNAKMAPVKRDPVIW